MNHSNHRWLLEQIPEWERNGLLTADAARVLRGRYAVNDSGPGLAQIVMGALGALLIGTGLIAVIGFNWDDFSRPVRLLFAFVPLLLTQGFSFRVLWRGEASAAWVRETTALLQAFATGACIALVSQIYNLGGEWPDFLFWWMLLSLPLAWVLRSHAVAIFYLVAIATWSLHQVEHGRPWHDSPLLYPLLLLGLLPFWPGWPRQTPLSISIRWVMAVSAILGLFSAAFFVSEESQSYSSSYVGTALWLCTLTAAVITLFPLNQKGIAESTSCKPQVILGALWLLGHAIAVTFRNVADGILEGVEHGALTLPWYWGLLAVLAVLIGVAAKLRRWALLAIASTALLPLVTFFVVHGKGENHSALLSWLATLHLAAIGLTLIMLEFTGRHGAPRLGAALLSVLIIARMADSDFSLLAKGIVFIAVGVAFLVFNILSPRLHRQPQSSLS